MRSVEENNWLVISMWPATVNLLAKGEGNLQLSPDTILKGTFKTIKIYIFDYIELIGMCNLSF